MVRQRHALLWGGARVQGRVYVARQVKRCYLTQATGLYRSKCLGLFESEGGAARATVSKLHSPLPPPLLYLLPSAPTNNPANVAAL